MKFDNAINLKVDEPMFRYLGKVSNAIDCTQSEFIRCCIQLAGPQIESHPYLIQLLPFQAANTIKQA